MYTVNVFGTEIRSGIRFQSSEKRLAWGFTRQNFDVQNARTFD